MSNKLALITGGGAGIGKGITLKLASNGIDCVIFDVQDASAVAGEAEGLGVNASFVNVDVTNFEAVKSAVSEVNNSLGDINILINNAGITRDNLLMRMKEDDWDKVVEINLKSVVLII